jgi:hypothetical protein
MHYKGNSMKLPLDMDAAKDSFFADAVLIGIASAAPGYKLCWLLNRQFDIHFRKDLEYDIPLTDRNKHVHHFPLYTCHIDGGMVSYLLYKLKDDTESLLPEARQLDYVWMIQGSTAEAEARTIIRQIREIPEIALAQVLAQEKLKNLANLML